MAINGLDVPASLVAPISYPASPSTPSESDSNYEPYDSRLAAKLRELYAQLEYESTRVAELRREAPGAAARAYMERLEAEMEEERERDKRRIEEAEDKRVGGGEAAPEELLGAAKMERSEEMERMWERGTEGLVGLEKVTEVLATLERARKAIEVVQEM